MEDISRELEREIARAKPSPYKKKKRKTILVIDAYGEVTSAGYLRALVYIFFVTSVVCLFAAIWFHYFFSSQAVENKQYKGQVLELKKKVAQLTSEKEVLMARLVISGKEPGGLIPAKAPVTTAKEKKAGIKEKQDPRAVSTEEKATPEPMPQELVLLPETDMAKENGQDSTGMESKELALRTVSIEKFIVTREGTGGDLLVRFDIRNISDAPGGVSGRIFTILKPENKTQKEWLVVPAGPLENGVPSQYRKGQYFSIAHFKPVKFRIESKAGPDFFKKAAIYIFNDNGDLMFESLIDITEAEAS
ncbi:MAG: hypothetical protein KKC20_00115 [Proteobacteria bacterium]|nr:hypothetical protein [Pseudomonadota bacterium]